MDLGIKDKKVLITGASQGIGKEIALSFAKEGCKVSVVARREKELEYLLEEMGKDQGHCYKKIDLMPEGNPKKIVNELIKENGNYDIVVHNLGGTLNVRNPLSSVEDYEKVWRLNVGIAIEINNLIIPPMQKQKWGRIIHISSLDANAVRGCAAYGPAKAYLNAYTKKLSNQFAKEGIVISALLPCAIYSEGGHWDEEIYEGIEKQNFLKKREDFMKHYCSRGKLGTAKEVSDFVVFMGSEKASINSLISIGTSEETGF
jgi:3-oxoacyl-[acyl-carrier protein] reductase